MTQIKESWYVYALCQPGTEEIRYIGKSDDPVSRLSSHRSDKASEAMREWMRAIRYQPILKVLEECDSEQEALDAEKRLIEQHWSGRLLNSFTMAGAKTGKRKCRFPGFGSRLRETRKSRRLTTIQLQDLTGIRQASISQIEHREDAMVEAATAHLLAKALGVSTDWLITGEQG